MTYTTRSLPLLSAVVVLTFLFLSPLAAQGTGGTVTGVATLDGAAIAGASVTIDCVEDSAYIGTGTTDGAGQFAIPAVPVGAFSIRVFDAEDQLLLEGSGMVEADGETVDVELVPPQG